MKLAMNHLPEIIERKTWCRTVNTAFNGGVYAGKSL
jgi:hypothetical protein